MTVREVMSLLETGSEELEKGNASAGLSILFEAQCFLGEIVQRQAEMMQRPASAVRSLGRGPRQKTCVEACSLADAAMVGPEVKDSPAPIGRRETEDD